MSESKQVGFVPLPRAGGALSHAVASIHDLQARCQSGLLDGPRPGTTSVPKSRQGAVILGWIWNGTQDPLIAITLSGGTFLAPDPFSEPQAGEKRSRRM